jgi:cyclopropane-fatty-acyl-phospholipid synthase
MSARQRLLSHLRSFSASEPIPLRLVFWDGEQFDFASPPRVTLTIRSSEVIRWFLLGRIGKLGDAYAAGDIVVDGAVEDILQTGISLSERFGRLGRIGSLLKPPRWLRFRHSKRNDAAAISHHYDVSNAFYRLWLDESMTYSCAYFRSGEEDIDQAQRQKIAHICRKLRLAPGDHVLDIGCGWGGLLRQAARDYGISGVGVTNSQAQSELARARIAAEGLQQRIAIELRDYRDIGGEARFDKIVSVGMYEHIGLDGLSDYFKAVARLLKPGGALLNHGIIVTDPDGKAQGPPGGEFIDRHVFPGGALPNLPRALQEVARGGLEPVDIEDLRPHYAQTLLHWVRRLEARKQRAVAAAGAERYRIWRIYLAGMAYAFDRGWLSVAQILAYKSKSGRPAERPWTRAYQYCGGAPAIASKLKWDAAKRPN